MIHPRFSGLCRPNLPCTNKYGWANDTNQKRIAKKARLTRETVNRALNRLEELGWVEVYESRDPMAKLKGLLCYRVILDPPFGPHGERLESPTYKRRRAVLSSEQERQARAGEGEAGLNGGPAGDLYVQVAVRDHSIFRREGKDLYTEVPISFVDAALGGELEVPTLDGRVKLKIPSETQTGKLFRLRGKGVTPVRGGNAGDLLCRVIIETPVNLSKDQKELLKQFQESLEKEGHRQSPKKSGWFDGVKSFFDDML